ncbi:MAG: hypothetical protein ACI9SQ_000738 [Rubritalea sp.]|jgi:hypothetical protein
MNEYLIWALKLAGLAQLVLVAGSVAIPKCLNWGGGLADLMPLLRQMFWTYAIYISVMHVFFGVVSLFAAEELVSGGFITTSLCVLMLVWWLARILIQFFYFDKTGIPETKFNQLAEVALVLLFAFLSVVYGWAVWENLQ